MSSSSPDLSKDKEKDPKKPSHSPQRARSSSRNKDSKSPAEGSSTNNNASGGTSRGGGHQRKTSGRGGGGRRGSQGAATAVKEDKDGASPPPGAQSSSSTPAAAPASEGLSNLKNIISELKDAPSANASASSSSGNPSPSSPSRNKSLRKNSTSNNPIPTIAPPPPPTSSTLNPNAGGFQPTMLGSISDMMDEGLVTPTASQFDLMTGLPRGQSMGGFRQQPPPFVGQGAELPEEVPGYGGVAGQNPRAFAFPQPSNPQQHFLLQQQQQAAQQAAQQQFQMQQIQNMGLATGAGGTAAELMAEQMNIQAQLESLRVAQENLLQRFGDMQLAGGAPGVSEAGVAASPQLGSGGPSQGHRRGSSHQQVGGTMGSFGQGSMGSFGQVFGAGGATGASGLPKGHGRRHSVNVSHTKSPSLSSSAFASPNMGSSPVMTSQAAFPQPMSPPMGFGALGGGFQFPPNGNQSSGHQHRASIGGESDFGGGGNGFRHHRTQSGSMSSNTGWQLPMNNHVAGHANLAEAQSHLQQLAAYRASAGHARVPSFGMSTLGGGPGQLAMAGYGGGVPQQQSGQQMRKSLFAPYLPQASIPPLLAAGKLVIGVLRVNKRNRSDAYVATDVLDADIYICGSKDRNRALEGDIVAIELLDVDEVWGTKKEKEEKKRKKEENASYDPRATRNIRQQDKKKDDVEVEGQGLMLFEEEEVNDEQKPQFAGHVVAVVERAPGQLFSGMLGVLRPSSAATQQKQDAERREREGVDLRGNQTPQQPPKIIWFRPTDKRVPLIAIPTEQAPADFIDHPEIYADRLFVACIKRWPISSLHPFGTLVEELGPIGDLETETNALLKDCNFSAEEFSDSVVKCLPPIPWSIPERETNKEIRRDYRSHRVFTVDPSTAKDLDDALHIVKNEDGTFEVGVHIADVTHFVKPNTALDREARKRATTVYLVQRAVPMLPSTLSEDLCSLNPGEDKLTFSVVFTLAPDGRVLSTWFGKTIIRSTVKLAYEDAQEVIEDRSLPEGKVDDAETRSGLESDLKMLNGLACQLRSRRFENGALRIDNVKVSIAIDENAIPYDCSQTIRKEANEMIEEFMLLANMSVAGKIAGNLPEQALLRRHEAPIDRRLNAFVDRMKRLGIELDGSSSGALMESFNKITDPASRVTLQHLSTKGMMRAKYFCAGMLDIAKFGHYALNVPLYTHFTSPIRRYADVMVHRQLEAVLLNSVDVKFTLDTEAVSKVAQTCNAKKEAARLAQEQSSHLFLCHLISDLTRRYGPVIRPATVIGVLDEAFDVLVTEFGIEKRVHVNDLPIENAVYDEHTNSLALYWKKGENVLHWLADNQNDAHLQRVRQQAVHATSGGAQGESESALFDDDDEDDSSAPRPNAESVKTSGQHHKSQDKSELKFEATETTAAGHRVQTVRELQSVPVCITADLTKSPPVLKVVGLNPFQ